MIINLLRKLNTKITIRLMMVLIVILSIVGTFRLFELFQNELLANSNYSMPKIIKNLSFAYFIPTMFSLTLLIFVLSFSFIEQSKISLKAFKKSIIVAVFLTLLIPGFLVFPEVYGLNAAVLTLPMSAALIIVLLARFLQNYTDEQICIMKSELKNLILEVRRN